MGASSSKPWEEDVESASPGGMLTPEEEIKRVLRFQNNYYKVLKVDPKTCTASTIKKAYYKIARVIHPDKCRDPRATQAMGVVTSANSTLSNTTLRTAYDMYASQVEVDAMGSDTFSEWESKGGAQMAHLPPWLVKGLANPFLGPIIQFFMVIFLLMLLVALTALFAVYFIIHMVFWVLCCCGCGGNCWPRYGEGARVHAVRQERFVRMLRDYEAEAAMARAKGEPTPDPNVFFANWNVAHPETTDTDGIPTANQYGSMA